MKAFKLSVLPLTQTFFTIIVIVVVAYLALAFSKSKVGFDTYVNDNRKDWQIDFATKDDSKSLIQGELTVAGDNNNIGGSWMPHQNGNIYVRPKDAAKDVYIGDVNTKATSIGTSADVQYNRVGPQSWFPYLDGNTYVRPGRENKEVRIGDWWTGGTRLGTGSAVQFNQIGQHTWLPYVDGNSYIRPGADNKDIVIGDMWTNRVWLGKGDGKSSTYVRGMLKVNRGEGDGYPQGWGAGVHAWDVYANGTVAVGAGGSVNSFINGDRVQGKKHLCIDGVCINKKQLEKLKNL